MTTTRLQKVLARAGIASRRAAEQLITAGRVRVDGRVVTELGTKVDPRGSKVEVDGKRIFAEQLTYVVLHKPRNVVATMSDPEGRPTVREILKEVPGRVYPVGRLDFATSGVLLATNDGDFAAALLHPRKAVPKTYVVKVVGLMEDADLDRWRKGVRLEDGPTLPAKVKLLRHEEGKTWFELTITEGRNQQIRRMGDATGFRVMRLARLSFAGVTSEGLRPGTWRYLTADELRAIREEHGVPRRIASPPAEAARPAKAARAWEPGREGTARGRGEGARGREEGPRGRGERPRGRGESSGGKGEPSRGRGQPSRGRSEAPPGRGEGGHGRGRTSGGSEGAWRSDGSSRGEHGQPRYGGGSPVRRDIGTTEDWGGGIRRGSSASHGEGEAPRGDVGGRGGRSRTTGTGGGIGAGEGSYRVKGRKGW